VNVANPASLSKGKNLRRRHIRFPISSAPIKNGLAPMALPEIILYSKPACCLCEKAKEQLAKLQEEHQFTLREVNILEDLAAHKMFKDEIPVVFINGRKAFKYRLDEKRFIRLLKSGDRKRHEESASAP
jgi:glutaredoxin